MQVMILGGAGTLEIIDAQGLLINIHGLPTGAGIYALGTRKVVFEQPRGRGHPNITFLLNINFAI